MARGLCKTCYNKLRNENFQNYPLVGHKKCENIYTIKGDIVYLTIISTKKGECTTYFNKKHLEKVKQFQWIFSEKRIMTKIEKKSTYLHQFITGLKHVDHIDRNTLNNLDNNFRMATKQENAWNSNISKNNTSGIIGVCFYRNYWFAELKCGEKKYRGCYKNKNDAIVARLNLEKKFLGEYAPQKHLFEKYNIE